MEQNTQSVIKITNANLMQNLGHLIKCFKFKPNTQIRSLEDMMNLNNIDLSQCPAIDLSDLDFSEFDFEVFGYTIYQMIALERSGLLIFPDDKRMPVCFKKNDRSAVKFPIVEKANLVNHEELIRDQSKYFRFKDQKHRVSSFHDIKIEDLNTDDVYAIDLRNADLRGLDLRGKLDILKIACFTTLTKFPEDDKMPEGFKENDRKKLLEDGKWEDFGMSEFRKHGITGKGVKVAIIDLTMNVEQYPEIAEKVKEYHHFGTSEFASAMHGIAVSSILCGKELGIAPDAELYYFSATSGTRENATYKYYIDALDEILKINKTLREKGEEPIRIVSVSMTLFNGEESRANFAEAEKMALKLKEMEKDGITVIHANTQWTERKDKRICFHGIMRNERGEFDLSPVEKHNGRIEDMKEEANLFKNPRILLPMSSRTTAYYMLDRDNPSQQQYCYDSMNSGISWTIPYFAGLFALSRQVNPEIELKDFYRIAQQTGIDLIDKTDKQLIGKIVQPIELIKEMEKTIDGIKVEKPNETWVEKITKSDKTCGQNLK